MAKLNERETARLNELKGKENKSEQEEQELADLQRKQVGEDNTADNEGDRNRAGR